MVNKRFESSTWNGSRRLRFALSGDSRNQFTAGFDLERWTGKIIADRLIAAAEMFGRRSGAANCFRKLQPFHNSRPMRPVLATTPRDEHPARCFASIRRKISSRPLG